MAKFFKIVLGQTRDFAEGEPTALYDDGNFTFEMLQDLGEEYGELCQLLTEYTTLTLGDSLEVSEAREHGQRIAVPMDRPIPLPNTLQKQPEVTDQPGTSPEDERKKQQQILQRKKQLNMGV